MFSIKKIDLINESDRMNWIKVRTDCVISMKKLFSAFISAILVLTCFSACSQTHFESGDVISIEGDPESGFEWVCRIDDKNIVSLSDTAFNDESGSNGLYTFKFSGVTTGTTNATFEYVHSGQDKPVIVRTYKINVDSNLNVTTKLIKETKNTSSTIPQLEPISSEVVSYVQSEVPQSSDESSLASIPEQSTKPESQTESSTPQTKELTLDEAKNAAVKYMSNTVSSQSNFAITAWPEYSIYKGGIKYYKFRMTWQTEENVNSFLSDVIVSYEGGKVLEYHTPEKSDASDFWSYDEIAIANNFAVKVIDAVKAKDLKTFASMSGYPIAVCIDGVNVNFTDKESFSSADPNMIFSDKLIQAVTSVDTDTMKADYHGFYLGSNPSIFFSAAEDGSMKITSVICS